jgi:hypothetical protein
MNDSDINLNALRVSVRSLHRRTYSKITNKKYMRPNVISHKLAIKMVILEKEVPYHREA